MSMSGQAIALSATTSATLAVATHHLPMWVLIAMGLLGATLSIINTEHITKKSALTTLITGASASAVLTNIIIDKFFTGTIYAVELSVGIALGMGLFGHLFFARMWARKEKIIDIAENATINKIESIVTKKQ